MKKVPATVKVHTLDDGFILADLETLGHPEWWEANVNSAKTEAYWSDYYNLLEEEAIRRGLI